jgi:hypothetical protein
MVDCHLKQKTDITARHFHWAAHPLSEADTVELSFDSSFSSSRKDSEASRGMAS